METFAVIFILMLLFVYVFITYVDRNRVATTSKNTFAAQHECYRISSLINRVRSGGRGFAQTVSLDTYVVKVFGNTGGIEVFFEPIAGTSEQYYCTFLTSNVTNTTDYNFIVFGDYRVANDGEYVTFNKV